jgi:hypothetical protein
MRLPWNLSGEGPEDKSPRRFSRFFVNAPGVRRTDDFPRRPPPPIIFGLMSLLPPDIPGVPLKARGKVRDIYDLGDELLLVATDRISAFDAVSPTPIPGKGILLTQMSLFWFELLGFPHHLVTADVDLFPTDAAALPRRVAGAFHAGAQGAALRRGMRGEGLPGGQRMEGLQGHRNRVRTRTPARAPGRIQAPRTHLHPRGQERHRPRREHHPRLRRRDLRAAGRPVPGGGHALALRQGLGPRGVRRDHPRRHQIRVRPDRRPHLPDRRGPHPRQLPLLAPRFLDTRPRPAELRQAVRARPLRVAGLGQESPRSRIAATSRGEDPGEVPRSLHAAHGKLERARPD